MTPSRYVDVEVTMNKSTARIWIIGIVSAAIIAAVISVLIVSVWTGWTGERG